MGKSNKEAGTISCEWNPARLCQYSKLCKYCTAKPKTKSQICEAGSVSIVRKCLGSIEGCQLTILARNAQLVELRESGSFGRSMSGTGNHYVTTMLLGRGHRK